MDGWADAKFWPHVEEILGHNLGIVQMNSGLFSDSNLAQFNTMDTLSFFPDLAFFLPLNLQGPYPGTQIELNPWLVS